MWNCPYCNAALNESELRAGLCAACDGRFTAVLDAEADADDVSNPVDTGTVDAVAHAQTVDDLACSDAGLETLDELAIVSEDDGTVDDLIEDDILDLDDFAEPPSPGKTTLPDRAIDQTIELGQHPADLPESLVVAPTKTIDDRVGAQTLDMAESPVEEPPKPGTVTDRAHAATIDSDQLATNVAETIQHTWNQPTQQQGVTITTSLKSDVGGDEDSQTTLVIQSRSFRQRGRQARGPADYDLLDLLGEGGMGMVYAARQASIDRTVAIKMLKPNTAEDATQRNKFLSEAAVTGELEHPNIVPIYDLGSNVEGALFYAMKRVKGTPWDEVVGDKSLHENLEILMKVCDAVGFAHSRGVVHRDLKPENVMLGGYGEVLVMDWGLAVPTDQRPIGGIKPSISMGGTPAYMAPEMAAGPFERIDATSDIYLLGAILYEITTGKPPHTGRDVMKCLFAAAKNDIVPTDKSGELVNIALGAMQTKQEDRYQSVQAFQDAIREYLSHSESIALSTRAADDLSQARTSNDYQDFARAVFGFQQAVDLWDGNSKAKTGLNETKLEYAKSAQSKGDFDLAASLLDVSIQAHAQLHSQVKSAQREREARQQRLKTYKRVGVSLVALFLVVVTGAAIWINFEKRRAVVAERQAKDDRDAALAAQEKEKVAKEQAEEAEEQARKDRDAAVAAREEERKAKEDAESAQEKEKEAKLIAVAAEAQAKKDRDAAVVAKQRANYEAYVARIGAASAKVEENAYDSARVLLEQCIPKSGETDHRNWEWGRLWYLCTRSKTFSVNRRLEGVAYAPDGARFVTGDSEGKLVIWSRNGQDRREIDTGANHVFDVAFSNNSDETYIAAATDDEAGFVKVFDATTGKLVKALSGHARAALSVEFSSDDILLLTGSYDETAKIWNWKEGQLVQTLRGHRGWVWDATFSPGRDKQDRPQPQTKITTVSQDGTAVVWVEKTGAGKWNDASQIEQLPTFRGHKGPVFAASFSSDGQTVVTGGQDRRVLVWKIADLEKFEYEVATTEYLKALKEKRPNLVREITPPTFQSLAGHTAAIRSVQFSRDGRIISGGHDNSIKVWNATNGELLKTLRGHGEWVRDCEISPDGRTVVSVGYDETVRLWNVDDYMEVRTVQGPVLEGHDDSILSASFSNDGKQIVTASRDRTLRTWDFNTGKELHSFREGHAFLAQEAVFFPLGNRLATAAVDNSVRLWNVRSGTQELLLRNTGRLSIVAVSRDGKLVLTGGQQVVGEPIWLANLWNTETGELIHQLRGDPTQNFKGHRVQVSCVAISDSGKFLFTGDTHGVAVLWDAKSGKPVRQLKWHRDKIIAATFLENDVTLITASTERGVALWDLKQAVDDKPRLLLHPSSLTSVAVSRVSGRVLTTCRDAKTRLWNVDQPTSPIVLYALNDMTDTTVNKVAISTDGRLGLTLKVSERERIVRLWDLDRRQEILYPTSEGKLGPFLDLSAKVALSSANFSADGQQVITVGSDEALLWDALPKTVQTSRARMRFNPHGRVASAQFSSDAARIVSAGWDGTARIWDIATGKVIGKLIDEQAAKVKVNCAGFSPVDPNMVITANDDNTVILWNAQTSQAIRTFKGHDGEVLWMAFSPDGRNIVTTSKDGTARVWDISNSEAAIQVLRDHTQSVNQAAFSNDGRWVITGSEDNTAKIWNASTGELKRTLSGHAAAVTSVAFSPESAHSPTRALTGSADQTAKLWDPKLDAETLDTDADDGRELKEILTLKGHQQEVTSVSFSHDGHHALTSSHDGTAIIWLSSPWDKNQEEDSQ